MNARDAVVGDFQLEPPLRVGLDDIAIVPGNRVGLDALLQPPDQRRWQDPFGQAAESPLQSHSDFFNPQLVVTVDRYDAQRNVVDTDHLAPVDVDDLLVKQVLPSSSKPSVGIVGDKAVVGQFNAFGGNRTHLVVTHHEGRSAAPEQEPRHASRMLARGDRHLADAPDAPALGAVDAHAGQLCEVDDGCVYSGGLHRPYRLSIGRKSSS